MKKEVRTTKSGYPLMRYLSLLLAMALLFSGVTFARFALERRGSIDTGVALFDASYTVEGVNSLAFSNQSYWMEVQGGWYAQGGARTVRVRMKNNSDVGVRAATLHMEGPADFWENIALQLRTVNENNPAGVAADQIITTQYVLADFLRVRAGSGPHNYSYGDYKNWGENEEFKTKDSDEFGQHGSVEEILQMSGGITAVWAEGDNTFDLSRVTSFSGTVTAVRQSASYTNPDQTGTIPSISSEPLTITITASMKTVEYSVGFARKQSNGLSMPAFYLDCVKTVPYYSIDITLPETDYFDMTDSVNDSTTSVIAFLTWTNSDASQELMTQLEVGQDAFQVPDEFCKATVIGYHFNYNDVPATQNEQNIETTVRMNKTLKTWAVGENGQITAAEVPAGQQITWEHIASINSDDGAYAHPLTLQGNNYVCSGKKNPVTIAAGLLGDEGSYDGSITGSFDTTTVNGQTGCFASEKGYAVSFSVYFAQSSELP